MSTTLVSFVFRSPVSKDEGHNPHGVRKSTIQPCAENNNRSIHPLP